MWFQELRWDNRMRAHPRRRNLVVHITDLHVLRDIYAAPSDGVASQLDGLLSNAARWTRRLASSLRLPLPVFEAIDGKTESPSEGTRTLASRGSSIWPEVALTSDLRTLHLDIDHTDVSSWSVVNELRLLGPILVLKQQVPNVSVTVVLPKLHPRYETQDRHFTAEDTNSLPFSITCRARQKCHA